MVVEQFAGLGGLQVIKLVKKDRSLKLPWTRLQVGSPVQVSAKNQDDLQLRGVVSHKKSDQISVALSGRDLHELPEPATFRLDLSADEITTQRQRAALRQVEGSNEGRVAELRGVLSGRVAPQTEPQPEVQPDPALNPAQQAAVRLGLEARDVALIHGPPGTGKTRTLVALMHAAVQQGRTVLATAPSNLAVDNMMQRLIADNVKVVRLGHPARVMPQLQAHSLSVLIAEHEDVRRARTLVREAFQLRRRADKSTRTRLDRKARGAMRYEAKQLLKDARRLEAQAAQRIIDAADVICATTSVDPNMLGRRTFDLAVIDEAAQSTEPGCWPPILRAQAVVLAGDHHQLPPTVVSPEAVEGGLNISLFERLMHHLAETSSVQLTLQYRMHEAIMGFSNQVLYEGQLQAHASVAEHVLSQLGGVQANASTDSPLEFIDSAGAGWSEELEPDGESRRNPQEAQCVLQQVQALAQAGLPLTDIAVITPYAAQARLLRTLLVDEQLEIDSVDGFQGREKQAVIISLVRSNEEAELGFVADVRRINVALTRARRKLIIIGDSATLGGHSFYRKLLSWVEAHGRYRSVWAL